MNKRQLNIIRAVSVSNLKNWGARGVCAVSQEIKQSRYPQVRLEKVIKRSRNVVNVSPQCEYKRITIKLALGGVVLRDLKLGSDIKTKRQFRVSAGQLVISKIDARNGAVGVVPKDLDGAIITGNFWAFDVDTKIASADYLSLVCASTKFVEFSRKNSAGSTNRQYLQEMDFLTQYIPLPSLNEQIAILDSYRAMNVLADEKEMMMQSNRENMEGRVQNILSMGTHEQRQTTMEVKSIFQVCLLSDMSVWSPKNYLRKSGFESSLYSNATLDDIVYFNPKTSFSMLSDDDEISFVPMSAVSDVYGTYEDRQQKPKKESKNYSHFTDGDLLWAKITPCMENGKSAVVTNLTRSLGFGSTEFYVMRSKDDKVVDIRYIAVLLRLTPLLQDAKKHFTGSAGQQRVPILYLKKLVLPLPPMDIQQAIICERNELETTQRRLIEEIRQLREDAKEQFETKIYS